MNERIDGLASLEPDLTSTATSVPLPTQVTAIRIRDGLVVGDQRRGPSDVILKV